MRKFIRYLLPDASFLSSKETFISAVLALIATYLCVTLTAYITSVDHAPLFVASIGATAVLVFAVPNSPLAQPWPLVGGHLFSATIGVFCFQMIPDFMLAIAMAVGLSILVMNFTKSLHPPAGAAALGMLLGTPELQSLGYRYVIDPVMINVIVMLILGLVINNLVPGRSYPNKLGSEKTNKREDWGFEKSLYNQSDLEAALKEMDSFVDVSHTELNRIYSLAVAHANKRKMGELTCADVMSRDVESVFYGTELDEAWGLLRSRNVKGLPVVDSFNRVLGVVTFTDFVHHANIDDARLMKNKMQRFLKKTDGEVSEKEEVVGQIMSSPAVTMSESDHAVQLISLFTEHDIHHIPIVDEKKCLVGMITRSDMMRAISILPV